MFIRRAGSRSKSMMASFLPMLILAGVHADNSNAGCLNDNFVGFSSFLAGCGGYEQTTPEFKAGARLVPEALSTDGSRIIGTSIAVLGDAKGYGEPAASVYESVRSNTGWETSAISPSSSTYPTQEFLDFNPDLNKGLWAVRRGSQSIRAEELAVREPDRTLVTVGSMIPQAAAEGPPAEAFPLFEEFSYLVYNGSSPDFSHVFFQMRGSGPLWPGDTTLPSGTQLSLYEYVNRHNTSPMLVGVDNAGRLISDCSTTLGSFTPPGNFNADTYNAISVTGETVFFTAVSASTCGAAHGPEASELYARIGTGEAARTIAISEPDAADCEECQTSERAAAEFAGASKDGTKVLFLTSQELLKGAVGENLYEYDFHNRPGHKLMRVSVGSGASEVQGVARVSDDGSHVYFVAKGVLTKETNAEGGEPIGGGENLYVFERDARHPTGHVAFIATLSEEEDQEDWQREDIRTVQATPDGRYLVFRSTVDLTNGDASTAPQVFEYDAAREELIRVSVGEKGYAAGMAAADVSGASITRQRFSPALPVKASMIRLAVSDDGAIVVFESAGELTEASSATGQLGVFEYRSKEVLSDGEVFSVSGDGGSFSAIQEGMDPSGEDVMFLTQASILPLDSDTQEDVYDVHDGGGFPAAPVAKSCEAELECQGSLPPSVGFGAAASVSTAGEEVPLPKLTNSKGPKMKLQSAPRLAKALQTCRRDHALGRKRRVCEAKVRKRLGGIKKKGER